MTLSLEVLTPGAAVVAGLLVQLFPRLVHLIVGFYLLIFGLIGLWTHIAH